MPSQPLLTEEDSTLVLEIKLKITVDVSGHETSLDAIRQAGRLQSLERHANKVARFFEDNTDAHVSFRSSQSVPGRMADAMESLGLSMTDDVVVDETDD